VNELTQVNLMLFFGLLGMGLGWQGGMRRLHGFYDIQPAVRMILYGLILGSFLALAIDELIFLPSYVLAAEGGGGTGTWPGLLVSLIVANLTSLVVMFLLTRRSVRLNKSAPTSGWALGLAMGSMVAVRLGFELLRIHGLTWTVGASIAILVVFMPQMEAVISSGQGSRGQRGERWLALFWATFWRFFGTMFLVAALLAPIWWVFLIPPLLIGRGRADKKWLMDSLTPEAQRRYRRVVAQSSRREKVVEQRKRRWREVSVGESE
tara:strand:- start:3528 stop:4319 length:792 start_codon:yes stop_codon:yes gene_type:complete